MCGSFAWFDLLAMYSYSVRTCAIVASVVFAMTWGVVLFLTFLCNIDSYDGSHTKVVQRMSTLLALW